MASNTEINQTFTMAPDIIHVHAHIMHWYVDQNLVLTCNVFLLNISKFKYMPGPGFQTPYFVVFFVFNGLR